MHVRQKFQDLTKVDNIEAQIFYFQQQLRMDSAMYLRVQAHSRVPTLINLMKQRMNIDKSDLNWQKFRLAITLQDMAFLKIEIGKYDVALFHLRETETRMRDIKSDEKVDQVVLEMAEERNNTLANRAQAHL